MSISRISKLYFDNNLLPSKNSCLFFHSIFTLLIVTIAFVAPLYAQTPCRGVVFGSFTENDYAKLVDMNVNIVTYELIWDYSVDADNSDSTTYNIWLDEELDFFDGVLSSLKSRGIAVVLKLHTPPGGFVTRTGAVTHRIFAESWAQTEIINAWQKIANRYKDESGIYAYDLLNEPAQFHKTLPAGIKDWNDLATDLIQTVRAIDSAKPIIVGSTFGDPKRYNQLKVFPFENLIYTFHYYHPIKYTHQCINQETCKFKKYPNKKLKRKNLKAAMSKALKFKKKHNVPMFVGEFAVARWAPGGDKYLTHVINTFEKNNICWTFNSLSNVHVWGMEYTSDFHNMNKSETMTPREALLRSYFARN